MKFIVALFLITNAFAQDDLSKAFNKRTEKSCVKELSEIRKYAREKAGVFGHIESVEIGKGKEEFALLYLKLKDGSVCSEQPSRNKHKTMLLRYVCRDKNGKMTIDKNIEAGPSDCAGDAPKFQ